MGDFEHDIYDAEVGFSDEDEFSDDEFDHEIFSDDDFAGGAAAFDNDELPELSESMQRTDLASANAEHTEVTLDEKLWSSLPEELLSKILTWLPPATLVRFRSVCSQWEALFSSPGWVQHYSQVKYRPSCSLMCTLGAREADFFCHMEQKWFEIPLSPVTYLELDWELVDSDAGVLLYQCHWSEGLWFCACNPLTESSKVLPPNYPHWDMTDAQPSNCELLKMLVDRDTHQFKVVVLVHSSNPPSTVVYDSTTSVWRVCNSYPQQQLRADSIFVWKKVVYSQVFKPNLLLAFDIDSGIWSEVVTDLPCHLTRKRFFVNNNLRLLLVQPDSKVEEPISVWELVDEDLNCSSASSKAKWKKLTLSLPENLKQMLNDVHSCFSQTDCIGFSTSHTNKWITYTFRTKSWRVMPSRGRQNAACSWFDWEPRLDIDVDSDQLYESD